MGASDRIFGRLIPKEHVGEAASWEFEPLGGPGTARRGTHAMLTERERRAFERGREEGHAAGLIAAQQQAARRSQHLDKLVQSLLAGFAQLEAEGADAVLDLALEVARQVLRREVDVRRDAVLAPLREAVASIIDQQTHPRVYLHPEDLMLLKGELDADGTLKGCRFLPDPAVGRAGCRVETQQAEVDATVHSRWRRVVAALGIEDAGPIDDGSATGGAAGAA
jgi:flagellar assembly protein FliH